jgi:putative endonuclease
LDSFAPTIIEEARPFRNLLCRQRWGKNGQVRLVIPTGGPRSGPEWRNLAANETAAYNAIMAWSKTYYVYIMANQSRTLYVGFTDNIKRRVQQHRTGKVEGFTLRYRVDALVYLESFSDVHSASAREKQIKHWARAKKLWLIEQTNPNWRDLSDGWY